MIKKFEKLGNHVFVTKLAGFEHSKYIQYNQTKKPIADSDIPLVQGCNIRNGFFTEEYEWYISKDISDLLLRSKLTKECILVPYVGSNLGEVGIFYHPYDCHLASNIAKIELIDDYFDLEFLKYYLQSPIGQKYLFQSKQGSAQPNITMEAIRNTLVFNYSIETQKKIALFFKKIDDKILLNNKINDNLQQVILTIFNRWFNQFEFDLEEGKTYSSSRRNFVFNSILKKEIPEGWIVENIAQNKLSSLIDVGVDYFTSKNYIATANVNGTMIQDGNDVTYENRESRANMQPSLNSIWFAKMKNSVKHIFISSNSQWFLDKYILSTGFCGINCTELSFPYIASVIMQPYFEAAKDKMAHGATQQAVNNDDLKNIPLLVPSDEVLQKYSKIVLPIFKKMNEIQLENQKLMALRDNLLPLLMNGQVTIR